MSDRTRQLQSEISAARAEALGLLSGLSQDQFERPSPNEGWSVKDTLAHISSIEHRLQSMWQHALDGREWPAEDADVHAYNARSVEERRSRSAQTLIDELERSGQETQAFVERLVPDDLDRTLNHPTRGVVTLEELILIVPRHLRAHTEDISAGSRG